MPDEITGQASTQVSSNTSWRNHSSAKLKKESLKTSQKSKTGIRNYRWVKLSAAVHFVTS